MAWLTKEEAQAKYPFSVIGAGTFIEDRAVIGAGAVIADRAVIGAKAVIGEGAVIADRAIIPTVNDCYTGNIIPYRRHIKIRIGCEIHTPAEWRHITETHPGSESDMLWWKDTGKRMLAYLVEEADLYEKKYIKKVGRSTSA